MQAHKRIGQDVTARFGWSNQNMQQPAQPSIEQLLLQIVAYLQAQQEQNLAKPIAQLATIEKVNPLDEYPDMMTAAHISKHLGISRRRVYELFRLNPNQGGIPNISIGASRRVKKSSFIQWLDGQE